MIPPHRLRDEALEAFVGAVESRLDVLCKAPALHERELDALAGYLIALFAELDARNGQLRLAV
jgi:hypothetical protein